MLYQPVFKKLHRWPQQPSTEKVLKSSMRFHNCNPIFFFQNIKPKMSSRTWMTLKSSLVIFQALEPLQPQQPHQPLQPQLPQQSLKPYFVKELPDFDNWIVAGTKMTNAGPFL